MLGPVWIRSVLVRLLVILVQAALGRTTDCHLLRLSGSQDLSHTRSHFYNVGDFYYGTHRFYHFLILMLDGKYTSLCVVVILRCVICRKLDEKWTK